jgi:3-oxoacyl-[acyl-carrier protein] reductase
LRCEWEEIKEDSTVNENRVLVVTGGGRGLGLAIVQTLLERGYPVATCSRRLSPELQTLLDRYAGENKLLWEACNIGQETEEDGFFQAAIRWAGSRPLFGLVNNAGIAGEGILATYPNVNTEEILRVNLLGAIRMARLALRVLLSTRTGGRIVNISSIIGSRGYTGLAAYSASKAGMDGLTRALAREVGTRQITVNSIAPGYLATDMSASLRPDQRQQIVRRTPLGRLGNVSDVVPLVLFLLSDDASFITGQAITVDGGIGC